MFTLSRRCRLELCILSSVWRICYFLNWAVGTFHAIWTSCTFVLFNMERSTFRKVAALFRLLYTFTIAAFCSCFYGNHMQGRSPHWLSQMLCLESTVLLNVHMFTATPIPRTHTCRFLTVIYIYNFGGSVHHNWICWTNCCFLLSKLLCSLLKSTSKKNI